MRDQLGKISLDQGGLLMLGKDLGVRPSELSPWGRAWPSR